MPENTLKELTDALKLLDTNVSAWSKTLKHPETGKGITRAAVYMAINEGGPAWILKEVRAVITKARREFPEYYSSKKHAFIL